LKDTDQKDWINTRVNRSKSAVLAAAAELLIEHGLGGVSVDAVVKRSGVAKTTIYRHWPSRTALLLDACSQLGARPQDPDTGSLRGDLEILLATAARRLTTERWPQVLPSVIDAAEREPEIREVHTRLHAAMTAPFRQVVERAQGRGELGAEIDPSEVVAAFLGPIFYRRWFSRETIDELFVNHLITNVLASYAKKGEGE